MPDQNTTTLIASAIAALSALGGAAVGSYITNHRAEKQDKAKTIEEKAKRKAQIIEEIYNVLIVADYKCDALDNDLHVYTEIEDIEAVEIIKSIRKEVDRVKVLVRLYLPVLRAGLESYLSAIYVFLNAEGYLYRQIMDENTDLRMALKMAFDAQERYKDNLANLQAQLEKQIESMEVE
jgi:hypothetical protein